MVKILILVVIAAIIEATGVVILSKGLKQIQGAREITVSDTALHAGLLRCELPVAADVAGVHHHDAGGEGDTERASFGDAVGRGDADCGGRVLDKLQRICQAKDGGGAAWDDGAGNGLS